MITRKFLKSLPFRIMTDWERNGFAGCESPVALIADFKVNETEYCVVLDGGVCEIYAAYADGEFESVEFVEDVKKLPY